MRLVFVKSWRPAPRSYRGTKVIRTTTAHQFNLIIKALHDGRVTMNDAIRAGDAYLGSQPLPLDLIRIVAGEYQ